MAVTETFRCLQDPLLYSWICQEWRFSFLKENVSIPNFLEGIFAQHTWPQCHSSLFPPSRGKSVGAEMVTEQPGVLSLAVPACRGRGFCGCGPGWGWRPCPGRGACPGQGYQQPGEWSWPQSARCPGCLSDLAEFAYSSVLLFICPKLLGEAHWFVWSLPGAQYHTIQPPQTALRSSAIGSQVMGKEAEVPGNETWTVWDTSWTEAGTQIWYQKIFQRKSWY